MSNNDKNKELIEKANQKKAMKELLMKNKGPQNTFTQKNSQQAYQKNQKSLKRFIKHK